MVDVEEICIEFRRKLQGLSPRHNGPEGDVSRIVIIQDGFYRRLKSTIDLDLAAAVYYFKWDNEDGSIPANRAVDSLRSKLYNLNEGAKHVTKCHIASAIDNILAGARYERLQGDGPQYPKVTAEQPFIHRYFLKVDMPENEEIEKEEALMYGEKGKFVLAHNGWVMNDDPLRNFAEPGSNIYLRRELIAWGDSCKLR